MHHHIAFLSSLSCWIRNETKTLTCILRYDHFRCLSPNANDEKAQPYQSTFMLMSVVVTLVSFAIYNFRAHKKLGILSCNNAELLVVLPLQSPHDFPAPLTLEGLQRSDCKQFDAPHLSTFFPTTTPNPSSKLLTGVNFSLLSAQNSQTNEAMVGFLFVDICYSCLKVFVHSFRCY
jgi:hypothetical protein